MASRTELLVLFLVVGESLQITIPILKKCGKYSECKQPNRFDPPYNMTLTQLNKNVCFCDPDCSLMNDCCPNGSSNATSRKLSVASHYWDCGKLTYNNPKYQMIYMVSSCPDKHPLQDLCSSEVIDPYDYKMDIPILSQSTGEWFRNIYCAACHGYHSDLHPIDVTLSCSGNSTLDMKILESANYIPGALMWIAEDINCTMRNELKDVDSITVLPWERPCVKTVDHCPDTWVNETVAELCKSYTTFVQLKEVYDPSKEGSSTSSVMENSISTEVTVFKNSHCAICHGVALEDLKCSLGTKFRRHPVSPSLRVIMDFSWDVAHESCQPPEGLWDGVHGCCQNLNTTICAANSGPNSRCCIPPSRRLKDSCARIALNHGEYRLLINKSLELISNKSELFGYIFAPGEYEILTDGRVEICDIFRKGLVDFEPFQEYLTTICLSISVICLTLHLIIHALLPKLHNHPGKNLQSLSIALLIAQLGFLVGITPIIDIPYHMCVCIAALLHFSYLAAFCWMNVMSIDIWHTFSATRIGGRLSSHLKYSIYAWGSPAILMILALVAHYSSILPSFLRPHFAFAGTCWFGNRLGLGIFMAAPVSLILVVNILLFFRTVCVLYQKQESRRYLKKKARVELQEASSNNTGAKSSPRKVATGPKDQIRFYLYVKLFVIMGLSWITGTIAVLAHLPVLWYPFIILNGLQGAFIFIMFDVKRNIMVMLWDRVIGSRYPLPSVLAYHSTGTTTDSSGNRMTSTTNLRSSVMSDRGNVPLMSESRVSHANRKLSRQPSVPQTVMADTALHHRTPEKVSNGHAEVT